MLPINRIALCATLIVTPAYLNAAILDTPQSDFAASLDGTAPSGDGAWRCDGGTTCFDWLTFDNDFGLGSPITISEIEEISWQTKKPVPAGNNDLFINIYTQADTFDDDASWYGRRITLDPLWAYNASAPANQWNTWTTLDGATNEVGAYDSNNSAFGFVGLPTFSDFLSGPLDWSSYANSGGTNTIDYRNEVIRGVAIAAGTGWSGSFTGAVDAISFQFSGNRSVLFDLESPAQVPTPGTLVLLGSGLLAVRLARGKRAL